MGSESGKDFINYFILLNWMLVTDSFEQNTKCVLSLRMFEDIKAFLCFPRRFWLFRLSIFSHRIHLLYQQGMFELVHIRLVTNLVSHN